MSHPNTLFDDLRTFAEQHQIAPPRHQLILKLAMALIDGMERPGGPARVHFTMEEFLQLPDRWELSNGGLEWRD